MPDPLTLGTAVAVGVGSSIAANELHDEPKRKEENDAQIVALLTALVRYADVQRESTLYPIRLNPGKTFNAREPLRVERITQSGDPGATFALVQGTGNLFEWVNVTGDPVILPLPLLLTGDISIRNLTNPASTNWRGAVFAYRDRSFGMDRRNGA